MAVLKVMEHKNYMPTASDGEIPLQKELEGSNSPSGLWNKQGDYKRMKIFETGMPSNLVPISATRKRKQIIWGYRLVFVQIGVLA
jgi:hypothetical protein